MSEQDPTERVIPFGDDTELIINRATTTLFTFWGKLAIFDHVYIECGERDSDDEVTGVYVWSHTPLYAALKAHIIEHAYPMELNQLVVQAEDRKQFFAQRLDVIAEGYTSDP